MRLRNYLRKPLHIPGAIGLVLLLSVGLWFFYHQLFPPRYSVIEVVWMSPDPTDIFHEFGVKAIKKRRFVVFPLSGLKTADQATLKNAQLKIRDLVASNDTTTGVRFTFTNTAKYWALIKALDICDYEKATSYIPYKNNIWVLNMSPSEYPKYDDIPPQ